MLLILHFSKKQCNSTGLTRELNQLGAIFNSRGVVDIIAKDSFFDQSQTLGEGYVYLEKKCFVDRTEYYFCRKAPVNLPRGFAIPHAIKDDIVHLTEAQKLKMQCLFDSRPIIRPPHAHFLQRVCIHFAFTDNFVYLGLNILKK